MTDEFNLSDFVREDNDNDEFLYLPDVKEFIKKFLNTFKENDGVHNFTYDKYFIEIQLRKLAGDKLI